MLTELQPSVQSYADVISRVTGIDVEIMTSDMVRVAGTGTYAGAVGESLAQSGEVYKEVMRTHKTILVESPRHHAICARCPDRENCRERFSLATPILSGGVLVGVIGLVCFNDVDRTRVLQSLDSYTTFISFLAEALGNKIGVQARLDKATHFLELMLQAVDMPGQGIMLFDYGGSLLYCNAAAREFLGLTGDTMMRIDAIQCSGHVLYEFEEFEVTPPGKEQRSLLGRLVELDAQARGKATLFVFELPSRIAQLAGNFSSVESEEGFDAIIGVSSALQRLKTRARKVAESSSTILISGESGTGKELLARAIHQTSPRRNAPFIAINCGGIPDTLLESELFGYVSGAFTGASSKGRMGKFELAEGGVIFLDEISSMPLYMQVKLLRVLQERVIIRLGSNRLVHVNVRVIAASNENLLDCIARNTFREDLYYRLNVIPLEIPPLRERQDDVPILAEFFLKKYCELFQKNKPRLRTSFLRILQYYPWPGNVRELEHVIEYAVNMMPQQGLLTFDCLPAQVIQYAQDHESAKNEALEVGQANTEQPAPSPDGVVPLHILEKRAIIAALELFGQSTEGKKRAAHALGLSLATLYRKMSLFSL